MTTQTYYEASMTLLAQADAELAAGDVRQASEKGWGAAAQIVKALAQQRDLPHQNHAALFRIVEHLSAEAEDEEITLLFQVAGHLHTNFYEKWDTAANVEQALAAVRRFVLKLSTMI